MAKCGGKETIAIPIIFVPGMMGSRLAKDNKIIWDPRSSNIAGYISDSPAERKKRLIGDKGKGFTDDYLTVAGLPSSNIPGDIKHWEAHQLPDIKAVEVNPGQDKTMPLNLVAVTQPRRRRGWGTVLWDSYGEFLASLENLSKSITTSKSNCHIYLPVYAHGYNWTASNIESGKKLVKTVDAAKTEMKELGVPCKGVMIITHSMGGFVARVASELHNKQGDIYGICHVAMPDNGSPSTYKRMIMGFEGGGFKDRVTKAALGESAKDVTAVLGHAPGGLELLPNEFYKQADGDMGCWLTIRDQKNKKKKLYKLSAKEVYTEPDKWWRLVNPEWLDPDSINSGKGFEYYIKSLLTAESFHDELKEKKHPNTWMIHGTGNRAWDKIEWRIETYGDSSNYKKGELDVATAKGLSATEVVADPYGEVVLYKIGKKINISSRRVKGDGTVHIGAGKHATGIRYGRYKGVGTSKDHQELMKDKDIQGYIYGFKKGHSSEGFIETTLFNFANYSFS